MKRFFLIILFALLSNFVLSQNYYRQYPITANVTTLVNKHRVEYSVFDSILGTWQFLATPYYEANLVIYNNNGGVVAYNAAGNTPIDNVCGFVTYDHVIHHFAFQNLTFGPNYEPHPEIFVNDIGVRYFATQWNTLYNFECIKMYDIKTHSFNMNCACTDVYCGIGLYSPWSGLTISSDLLDNFGDVIIYDPSLHNYFLTTAGCYWGIEIQDDYCVVDGGGFCSADFFSSYNSNTHAFSSFSLNGGNGTLYYGIADAYDYYDIEHAFAFFDEFLGNWVADYKPYFIGTNVKIKDRIVAYTYFSPQDTTVNFMTYDFNLHSIVKDSVIISGYVYNTLQIDSGTVKWTDVNGPQKRGYDSSLGWGNYDTPLNLNFYLVNLFPSTGEPIIHVRNYSIGTDSVTYDFGDGVISRDNAHVLFHMYEGPGPYTVTINRTGSTSPGFSQQVSFPCIPTYTVHASCGNSCSGSIELVPPSGGLNYSVLWSTGDTTMVIDSLCTGNYTYSFSDGNGCTTSKTLQINKPVINIESNPGCFDTCSASVIAHINYATAPLSYYWNSGDTTSFLSNACAGNYTLTIMDGNQCVDSAHITINPPLNYTLTPTLPSCICCSDGCALISMTFGTPPYFAYWPTFDDTSFTHCFLDTMMYEVYLFDSNGCSDTITFSLTTPAMTAVPINQNPSCASCSDGWIKLNIAYGTPPYIIYWNPNNGAILNDSIYNLPAGVYSIYISDNNNCEINIQDTLDAFVSINAHNLSTQLQLFPNPTFDIVTINSSDNTSLQYQLEVKNMLGEILLSLDHSSGNSTEQVDMRKFTPGIYLFDFKQKDKADSIIKVIKY